MSVTVSLDRLTPYLPGETVTGRILYVRTAEPTLAKPFGLRIQFKGKSMVKFTVMDNFNYKGRWRTHSSSELYFNSSKYLIGNGTYEVPELSSTGVKEFPFSYTLPHNIPSSYKGTHGSIDYTVNVTLKRSWGVNKEISHLFQVNSELVIGDHSQTARQLSTVRKSEKIGMLWWGGTIFVNFNLKKKYYIPGECINFSAQIINDSNSKIHKAKLLLTQECRYYAQGGSHTVTHIIKKVKGPGVKSGENTVAWDNNTLLKIPQLPPTNLGGLCRLIEINYFVHLLVQPASITLKDKTVTCKLPITIGTKRGSGNRMSYAGSTTGSLVFGGNRVGNIFGSQTTTPRGTIERLNTPSDTAYYQNVVFPLTRCFSAPVYENYRFNRSAGITSPLMFNEGFVEETEEGTQEDKYEPPPTYEEAMRVSRLSTHSDDPLDVITENSSSEVYQNSIVSTAVVGTGRIQPLRVQSTCTSPLLESHIYNNS